MSSIEELNKQFKKRTGYNLNLENPRTYCEKVQYRKVYDRRPILPLLADKITARYVVRNAIGTKYLVKKLYPIETITLEEIEKYLMEPCVIKAAHGCAWMIFQGANGQYLSAEEIQKHTDYWMENTYGEDKLQWAETQITPGVLVEEYMTYKGGQCPLVKVYCFEGEAMLGEYIEHGKHKVDKRADPATVTFYDPKGKKLDVSFDHIPSTEKPAPAEYAECVELSEKLTRNIDHLRVDWLLTDDGPKFSEFTWYPTSGMFKINPSEMDLTMGEWWELPCK